MKDRTSVTADVITRAMRTVTRNRSALMRRNTWSPAHQPSTTAGKPTRARVTETVPTSPPCTNKITLAAPKSVKMVANVARNGRGVSPKVWNEATSGGPFVPVEVVRTPVRSPIAINVGHPPPIRGRCQTIHVLPSTVTATSTRNAVSENVSKMTRPSGNPRSGRNADPYD